MPLLYFSAGVFAAAHFDLALQPTGWLGRSVTVNNETQFQTEKLAFAATLLESLEDHRTRKIVTMRGDNKIAFL